MQIGPTLPKRINRLDELAHNLWWSWHPRARQLFRTLDYPLWRLGGHNPVKQLRDISPDRLQAIAGDTEFLTLYDEVISAFDADLSRQDTWCVKRHTHLSDGLIAYFSPEFAIHNSLPIYAGGLGVLAGDTLKEASDLGIPMVGIGFMYPQGYFQQRIGTDGWQQEIYRQLNFEEAPVSRVLSPRKQRMLVKVELADRTVFVAAREVRVGCVSIYLLDTDIEENSPQDRQLTLRLYTADREQRIQQEIILGVGGVRVLRALGLKPSIWHANEGHSAFMMVERLREELDKGASFAEATERIRSATIFTTHTPVPAGHDVFPKELMEKYFSRYTETLGIDRNKFLSLGQYDSSQGFNMTVLALKLGGQCSAVSRLHGSVTRRMWNILWPQLNEDEVPIKHVTNGVHVPTWAAQEMGKLYEKYLGPDISQRYDDPTLREAVLNIPDEELWAVRRLLKRKLIGAILERAQKYWAEKEALPQKVLALGALLNPEALTVGFVRRFTEYKRPALVFRDIERLKKLVKNDWRPLQIIFAGKSHPADSPSKYLLQQVYQLAIDHDFQGRIAFVEDYDMHIARYLVQGVDVWLNTPRRLQEACGTSGIKAAVNGVLHLSVRDGWWYEGYNGTNGWAIGGDLKPIDPEEEDRQDAESLYRLLENEVIPLYYRRDNNGIPHDWLRLVKESIGSLVPKFSARRMMKEYTEYMYLVSAQSAKDKGTP
ncbi:MAG: alpha-glucan family phosphorylase [Chloroflexota bacterium]